MENVATVLTVYGIETQQLILHSYHIHLYHKLQQYLPFTVYNENTHKSLVIIFVLENLISEIFFSHL